MHSLVSELFCCPTRTAVSNPHTEPLTLLPPRNFMLTAVIFYQANPVSNSGLFLKLEKF